MRHTLTKTGGVGLAAPQVGESLRLVVIQDEGLTTQSAARRREIGRDVLPPQVLINPRLSRAHPLKSRPASEIRPLFGD